jgi:hypothetical protein
MRNTYIDYEEYELSQIFINGDYWGLYEIREKADEHYVETNYGINSDNIDMLNGWTTLAGSDTGFYNLYDFIIETSASSDEFYNGFSEKVDVENYVDYYIGEIYYQNVDFGGYYWGLNNIKFWRDRTGGKWRHIMYDMDGAMGYFGSTPYDNYIDLTRSPWYPSTNSEIFDKFLNNTELKNYFVNRFADLINTIYQPEHFDSIAYAMESDLLSELSKQTERWGMPTEWDVEYYIDNLLSYNSTRIYTARQHINESFALDGQRTITLQVDTEDAGYIHISTITPTELPWSGVYFDGVPVTITAIANPGFIFDHWESNTIIPTGSAEKTLTINLSESDTFIAVFTGVAAEAQITVTEINYNSDGSLNAGDWIEIYNNSANEIDISGWKIKDNNPVNYFEIPFGLTLDANAFLIIAEDTAAFKNIYPGTENVTGGFNFNFNNDTDQIILEGINGNMIFSMNYADSSPWPSGADGTGRTLELITSDADLNNPSSWFDGCMLGSPGTLYTPCNTKIVFGEINYNSSPSTDAGDWIELWNPSADVIDISGWKFADDKDTMLYLIPWATTLSANERLVVSNNLSKFDFIYPDVENTGPFLFGLDAGGEELRLINKEGVLQFSIIYDDDAPWPVEPDGLGKTLEVLDAAGKMNNAENWFAGCEGGSPGAVYQEDCGEISIENIALPQLIVYPNPAKEYTLIELNNFNNTDDLSFQLTDISGKIIQQAGGIKSNKIILNRNRLPQGAYYFKLIHKDFIIVKEISFL